MAVVHELTRTQARRIAVRAQLLDRARPTDLLGVVRHLGMLQLDPTNAIAPSADLVLWTRLGSAYERGDLVAALADREVIELLSLVRPADDVRLYRSEMAEYGGPHDPEEWHHRVLAWVETNEACRFDILSRLEEGGALPSRVLPDTCVQPWTSTGWTNNKNVTKLLEALVQLGEVAVAGRRGRERLWDLAERVYPDGPAPPTAEAVAERNARRLTALGIARERTTQVPVEPVDVGLAGEPAVVAGVRGEWRVDPALLEGAFRGRVALLSPFDRLVHDRVRMGELFEFDYHLEMFKPAASRRWGYFALPVLSGDRLVGKLDAKVDHRAGVLEVFALHEDVPLGASITAAVDREVDDLARWLDVEVRRHDLE